MEGAAKNAAAAMNAIGSFLLMVVLLLERRSDALGARRLGPRRLARVNEQRRLVHFTGEQRGHGLQRARNALLDRGALVGCGLLQYPVHDFGLHARMANTQAQAPVVARAELRVDVAQ